MLKPLTLSALFILSHGLNVFANDKFNDVEYAKEMTKQMTDWHAIIDLDINKSVMEKSTYELIERPTDKDLAKVVLIVNRAPKASASDAQKAKLYIDGRLEDIFNVSTGKIGHESRLGYFRPVYTNHLRLYKEYYSGKYGSHMSRAIFYSGGYAIHHTNATYKLGSRASHGCIRFHMDDIDKINKIAMSLGSDNYSTRKWRHGHHPNWKQNIFYRGLARKDVAPINRYNGVIDYDKVSTTLDMVILIKDQRR